MSFDDEPEDWVSEIFAEAQESVSSFKRVASMLGPNGSMSVMRRAVFRERPRAKYPHRKTFQRAAPEGFALKAPLCLLCGKLSQEYGSCRCADCNRQRRLKRKPNYRLQRVLESSP
jgi:hypothetical protein